MARKAMDDGAEMEPPEPEVTPPAAQTVTNTIQEHMREFRVSWLRNAELSKTAFRQL